MRAYTRGGRREIWAVEPMYADIAFVEAAAWADVDFVREGLHHVTTIDTLVRRSQTNAPAAPAASGPTTTSSTTSSNLFDLETYISRYESNSETRLQRLLLVASVSQSKSSSSSGSERMAEQAYRLAERQCRDAANVRTYRQVFGGQVAMGAAAGSGSGGEF